MTAPERFDIAAFAGLARRGDGRALDMLLGLLMHIETGGDMIADGAGPASEGDLFHRLADDIGALLAHPDLTPTVEAADALAQHNRHLAAIFRMAGPGTADRVWTRVREAGGDDPTGPALVKTLAAYTLGADGPPDWRGLLTRAPEVAYPFFIANFSHRVVMDAAAERRRDELFELAPMLDGVTLRPSALQGLSDAWMLCSYATAPGRHGLKGPLNGMVRGLLGRPAPPAPRAGADKPTIVVVAEALGAGHAITKTYAHFLGQLRGRFRMVLVSLTGRHDEAAAALFDDVVSVGVGPGLFKETLSKIKELDPDMVYYPSVGMTPWTVGLCNLRLAPVQVASVGHPATTSSDAIDFMVMGHEYLSDPALYSERIMVLGSSGALFTPGDTPPPPPNIRDRTDVVRVAVPASSMKLNARFLGLCARAAEASGRAVEVHFFPNLNGIRHRDCEAGIHAFLPGARVHRALPFAEYIHHLNDCDLRFGTFPFGGANTSVDALRQGLPTLVMDGAEPHSRTDRRFIRLFGLPDWLLATTEAEYEAAAVRLLSDDAERARIARSILDADPEHVLFEKEHALYPTEFADLIQWLLENHDRVRASDKRVWTPEDRARAG